MKMDETEQVYDVIIVGAGVSGSTAAYTLKKSCPNLKMLMIEGKDRVGGRTQTIEMKGCGGKMVKFDAGGQWVTDTQETLTALFKELDIQTYDQYDKGLIPSI